MQTARKLSEKIFAVLFVKQNPLAKLLSNYSIESTWVLSSLKVELSFNASVYELNGR